MKYNSIQKSFLEHASIKISSSPESRLNEVSKDILERNNFVFDAHAHFFDGHSINVKYFIMRIVSSGKFYEDIFWRIPGYDRSDMKSLLKTKQEIIYAIYSDDLVASNEDDFEAFASEFDRELEKIEEEEKIALIEDFDKKHFIKRIRQIIKILRMGKMDKVYTFFRDKYAIDKLLLENGQEPFELLAIGLGMDLNMGWEKPSRKSQVEQNIELGALAKSHPVLPFLPLDPRRANLPEADGNLYQMFLKAFNVSDPTYFGVKCYPALGYLPSDERLEPIFKICEEKQIPVLTHCGGNIISIFATELEVNRGGKTELVRCNSREELADYLNNPAEWIPVLEKFPKLKLCLAHFGGDKRWEEINTGNPERIFKIIDMLENKNNNVYTDFSFSLNSNSATDNLMQKILKGNFADLLQSKTLFGTDFWVVMPGSNLNTDQDNFIKKLGNIKFKLLRNNVLSYLGLENFIK